MNDQNTTPDGQATVETANEPQITTRLKLNADVMAERIAAIRAMQPEVGNPHETIRGILDVLELQTRAIFELEIMLIGK